jgi:DNA polymerase I-like protein with 3'-5' exonuclease and polymerase domains
MARRKSAPCCFTRHIRNVEDDFWGRRFAVYAAWRKEQWQRYLVDGFVSSLTGFTYRGVMRRNEVINYPIQGSAFHCLLWSLIETNRWLRNEQADSRCCGQIHDSQILDLHPEETSAVFEGVKMISEQDLRAAWDWIIVPLEVEFEVAEVDRSWYEKKEWRKAV